MTSSPSMLPVSGEQHGKALDAAGWEETSRLGRIGSEAAEVAVAAYFASLAAQGVRLVDQGEVDCEKCKGSGEVYWKAAGCDDRCQSCGGTGRRSRLVDRAGFVREVAEWLRGEAAGGEHFQHEDGSTSYALWSNDEWAEAFFRRFGGGGA